MFPRLLLLYDREAYIAKKTITDFPKMGTGHIMPILTAVS